jgi:adenylate kinase family enzyme
MGGQNFDLNVLSDIARPMRVVVVGPTCSGKTTFATDLSKVLVCPCYDLDELNYGPGWEAKAPEDFRAVTKRAAAGDRWIFAGKYSVVQDILWSRGTIVVWLNLSFPVVITRTLRRTLRRLLVSELLWNGNRESIWRAFFSRHSIILWAIVSYHRRKAEFHRLRQSRRFPHLAWIEVRNPAEVETLLRFVHGAAVALPTLGL